MRPFRAFLVIAVVCAFALPVAAQEDTPAAEPVVEPVTPTRVLVTDPVALHLPAFHDADIFRQGQPTMIAFGQRDVRQGPGTLPMVEATKEICYSIPWFKHDDAAVIEQYAAAFKKVALQAEKLLETAAV